MLKLKEVQFGNCPIVTPNGRETTHRLTADDGWDITMTELGAVAHNVSRPDATGVFIAAANIKSGVVLPVGEPEAKVEPKAKAK